MFNPLNVHKANIIYVTRTQIKKPDTDRVPASTSGSSWSYLFPKGHLFLWSRWLATFSAQLESLQRREFFLEPVLAAIAISKQEGGSV